MLCLTAAGCGPTSDWRKLGIYERIQHANPDARLSAVLEAGRTRQAEAVPYLVDRLTDSVAEVRMFAILSLERITGQTLGYRYYDDWPRRAAAVKRWRQWLEDRVSKPSATTRKGRAST